MKKDKMEATDRVVGVDMRKDLKADGVAAATIES